MMNNKPEKIRIGILPGMLDLYNRLCPNLKNDLADYFSQELISLNLERTELILSPVVSTKEQVEVECKKFLEKEVDLIIIALAPYCPSGVLGPSLLEINTPILLWPAQNMYRLEPNNYDFETMILNHGVHAVQDLANMLRKNNKNFGIIHGHSKQDDFNDDFGDWAKAARAVSSLRNANPIQIGGHFEDMLDLQIGTEKFIDKLGLKHTDISLDDFCRIFKNVSQEQIEHCMNAYQSTFVVSNNLERSLLEKSARGEIALRTLMKEKGSFAFGLNFLELCNDSRIAEPLHVAGSVLMSEGFGYAAEGDWVTASFVYAMQQAFSVASFSEIFSVGYADNRLVLKHWGEGNIAMAREKARLASSEFNDKSQAKFTITDFEFEPGPVTLINLNSTPQEQGQVITITGSITEDDLPKVQGPKAIFKPDRKDVRELLTNYAYNGGSHHLAVVKGDVTNVTEKMCRLAGWKHIKL